jgi:hypothetical protein
MKKTNDLLKFLIAELQMTNVDEIPKGFFSVQECAKEMDRSLWTVRQKLQVMAKAGKLERKLFRVKSANGSIISVPFYKTIKK